MGQGMKEQEFGELKGTHEGKRRCTCGFGFIGDYTSDEVGLG